MWTSVGAGSHQSAPVLALKRVLPAPKRFLRGRGAARLHWADALRTSLTVSGWVDSLEGEKGEPFLAAVAGTIGEAVGPCEGGLREARIGGIGNVLVPGRMESSEDYAADRTDAIEAGMLTTTVDTERGGGIAASHDRLLKASFWTALVSTSVGRTVMEESADRAGLCLFFA